MFTALDDISKMTIGPPHRSSLGIGWRRGSHPAMPRARNIIGHARGKQDYPWNQRPFLNVRAYLFLLALVSVRTQFC